MDFIYTMCNPYTIMDHGGSPWRGLEYKLNYMYGIFAQILYWYRRGANNLTLPLLPAISSNSGYHACSIFFNTAHIVCTVATQKDLTGNN